MITRALRAQDWPDFWPMLKGMGTDDDEATAKARYERLVTDARWGILGAVDSGRLVGYVAVQDYGPHLRVGDLHRTIRMHDLFVLPDDRHRGVGRALVDAATEWTAAHGRYLQWQAGAKTSAPFYERLGYRGEPCPQPEYPTFVIDLRPGS